MLPCQASLVTFEASLSLDFDGAFVEDKVLAWVARNASKPGVVRYEGVIAGVDFSNGITFTATDGASLDQSGSVAAGDCATANNGKVHCAYRDPSVKKKVARARTRRVVRWCR